MKLLIFDMDGTLVDSAALLLAAQEEALLQHGHPHPGRQKGLDVVGLTLDIALGRLTGSGEPETEMAETYKRVFNRMRVDASNPANAEHLYAGVADGLAALSQRHDVVLGIATGKTRRGYDYLAERQNWLPLFKTVQTADSAPSKPHPGMILQAMADTGIGAEATFMIGDSNHDMEMAVAAGVTGVGVSWGFQPVEVLRRTGARHIVGQFSEIGELAI
jgi:phosphoglycolate phosphatase